MERNVERVGRDGSNPPGLFVCHRACECEDATVRTGKPSNGVLIERRLPNVLRFVRRCAVAYTGCFAVPSNSE